MRHAIAQDTADLLGNARIENASLLFEKFLLPLDYKAEPEQKDEALSEQIHRTHRERAGTLYATLQSRLAINLADGLLENAGICLDRNTGSPYIPASAVKGCCHHAAYWMKKEEKLDPETTKELFGTTEAQGEIVFLPDYPEGDVGVDLDILTPHPREHGREKNPVPNKYPVVKEGTRFAFSYYLNRSASDKREARHELIQRIFEAAFEAGMGAKTAAGLGWFQRDSDYETEIREQREKEAAAQAEREEAERLEAARLAEEARRKAEAEAKQREAEKRKVEEEEAARQAYEQASPEERLRIDWSQMSKGDFAKELAAIGNKSEAEQRILLEVFLGKNEKNRKKFLKDKKVGPRVKEAAQALNIQLP